MALKKKTETATPATADKINVCTDFLLFVFSVTELKGGWYRFNAKMNSKPLDGEKYGTGVFITIMAKSDTCVIDDDVTGENQWVKVSGTLNAADYQTKDGLKGTGLTLWADIIKLSPKRG